METTRLNIFSKTTYTYSEEDRVTNAFLIVLQHSNEYVLNTFIRSLGITTTKTRTFFIRDHVHYDEHNIIDGEISNESLLIAIESKIFRNQFIDHEQVNRYLSLIFKMKHDKKILLLISPDHTQPKIISELEMEDQNTRLLWFPWKKISSQLNELITINSTGQIEKYLITEFNKYLEDLELTKTSEKDSEKLKSQLNAILGNDTAEKVLLHIYHFGSSYATQIARDHGIHLYSVQNQLQRFEKGGILNKVRRGRTVMYSFDYENQFTEPLVTLIGELYESIPLQEKSDLFSPEYKRRKS